VAHRSAAPPETWSADPGPGANAAPTEVSKGEFIVLDPEEIDAAKPESSTTIDIGDFVLSAEIDPIYFRRAIFWSRPISA